MFDVVVGALLHTDNHDSLGRGGCRKNGGSCIRLCAVCTVFVLMGLCRGGVMQMSVVQSLFCLPKWSRVAVVTALARGMRVLIFLQVRG